MSLRTTRSLALLLVAGICTQYVIAQGSSKVPEITRIIDLASPPASLAQLVSNSDVVLRGHVEGVLRTRNFNPKIPGSVETDMDISADTVLKGIVPGNRVVVAENGGVTPEAVVHVKGDQMMQKGEEYFLFLKADPRSPMTASGPSRYTVTGAWNGKFRIENGIIKMSERSSAGLRIYKDQTTDRLLTDLNAVLPKR